MWCCCCPSQHSVQQAFSKLLVSSPINDYGITSCFLSFWAVGRTSMMGSNQLRHTQTGTGYGAGNRPSVPLCSGVALPASYLSWVLHTRPPSSCFQTVFEWDSSALKPDALSCSINSPPTGHVLRHAFQHSALRDPTGLMGSGQLMSEQNPLSTHERLHLNP